MAKTMPPSDMIIRRVKVDRSLRPQQVLDATGRKQLIDDVVVASMPVGVGEEVEVCFLPLEKVTSDAEVKQALSLRGLVADPYAQAQVNAEDPVFANKYPNGICWKDENDNWNFVAFYGNYVLVNSSYVNWDGLWWVAGSRPIKPLVA